MRPNEPQGNDLLAYAGLGIYLLAVVAQMFSFWTNGIVWTWLSVKYLALLALGVLPLLLFESRATLARVYAGFFAVLGLTGQLSYSDASIPDYAGAKRRALELRIEEAEHSWQALDSDEYRRFKYYDDLLASLNNESREARASMKPKEWEAKETDLREKRDSAEKSYKDEVKDAQNFDAAEELSELRHDLIFEQPETKVLQRREDLRSAKALDFFILLGIALFVAGCLAPGVAEVPPYVPPAPAVKEP